MHSELLMTMKKRQPGIVGSDSLGDLVHELVLLLVVFVEEQMELVEGVAELPIFMLAKGGKIIADDARKVRLHLEDEHADPTSGKPVANDVVYEYEDGPERYRVSYRRSETIVDDLLVKRVSGFKHLLAKLARFDGAYLRFTGNVQLERFVNGELVEDVSDPGIWEMMYFGHVYQ